MTGWHTPACKSRWALCQHLWSFLGKQLPHSLVYCLWLLGGYMVDSLWQSPYGPESQRSHQKILPGKILLTSGVHKAPIANSACVCWGGGGWSWFVLECLLEFIPMRVEWPRWNVIARGCGRSRFSSPYLQLRKLLCGSFLPFCTALIYKVCFLEVGEKQMWAERSEVGGRVLSILLTSHEKWCLQVWAIGIKRKGGPLTYLQCLCHIKITNINLFLNM